MVSTETEAGLRWCPMVRVGRKGDSDDTLAGVNTEPHHADDNRDERSLSCSGSKCMMWRWADPVTRFSKTSSRRGYCGLAGVPREM